MSLYTCILTRHPSHLLSCHFHPFLLTAHYICDGEYDTISLHMYIEVLAKCRACDAYYWSFFAGISWSKLRCSGFNCSSRCSALHSIKPNAWKNEYRICTYIYTHIHILFVTKVNHRLIILSKFIHIMFIHKLRASYLGWVAVAWIEHTLELNTFVIQYYIGRHSCYFVHRWCTFSSSYKVNIVRTYICICIATSQQVMAYIFI